MSDVTYTYTLGSTDPTTGVTTGAAAFQNGATLSGQYTVTYNADGTIASVTDISLVATAADGVTEDVGPLNFGSPIVDPTTGVIHYTLSNSTGTLSGPFSGINIVYNGENPTHLSVNPYGGQITNLQSTTGTSSSQSDLESTGGGTLQSVEDPTCFCAGTAVTTPSGDVAIETLSVGDLVMTAEGEIRPIRWIGRQTISTRFADPLRLLPIRISAGALGNNLPVRDLLVSSCHALLIDGVLVQAGALVNGMSIVRESNMPTTFVYYHVELADHALMLAEGVPAETFVDNVNRMGFDSWAEHEALGVDGAIVEMDYPRAQSARQVPQEIHSRLLMQAILMLPATKVAA